jgi:beta-ribofuranosylaminobenzene 5'-phosphate synthase
VIKMLLIQTGSRIHLGFFNIISDYTAYGSVGVSLDKPSYKILADIHDSILVENDKDGRVFSACQQVVRLLNIKGLKVKILEEIPAHVGFGSMTQLKLALGVSAVKLYKLNFYVRDLAGLMGLGIASGIGIASFENGGFIIDAGRLLKNKNIPPVINSNDTPKVISRIKLPKSWRFILVTPLHKKGLDESRERLIMMNPKPMPSTLSSEISRLILTGLAPAVLWSDARLFGKVLTKIQFMVGEYFKPIQGGIFCCDETEFIVKTLIALGAYGAGQSSWGPTAYGIIDDDQLAEKIVTKLKYKLDKKDINAKIMIAKPRNHGAVIKII